MVAVMYSAGLRIGEVCRLRYDDIERKNMRIHICHSKNRQDRYAILSKTALDLLTIKALLGHKSLSSTAIYVHLGSNGTHAAQSPFDRLGGVSLG